MKAVLVICIIVVGMVAAAEIAPQILARAIQEIDATEGARVKRDIGESMRRAFIITDSNGDGHITKSELIAFIQHTGITVTPTMRLRFYLMLRSRMFDLNRNGTLEQDEYSNIARMGLRMNGMSGI